MKNKVFSYVILIFGGVLILFLAAVSFRKARIERSGIVCRRLEVIVEDSTKNDFVAPQDIKTVLDNEYGEFIGRKMSELNLRKMETAIEKRSAINKCEAYVTLDSTLRISVTQREPVIRFQTPGRGFYADRDGRLFPLQKRAAARVPVVDGDIPLAPNSGFKDEVLTEKEKEWVRKMIAMTDKIAADRDFRDAFVQIHVTKGGEVILVPRQGRERFLIGQPVEIEEKLHRIKLYYTAVAPAKDEGYYRTVNVKFDNQIICKK